MKSGVIGLLLLISAGSASRVSADGAGRGLPNAQAFAAAVLDSRLDLETFDFEAAGYWKSHEVAGKVWLSNAQVQLFGIGVSSDSCDPGDRRRFGAVMWLMWLQQSADAPAWRATRPSAT